MARLTREVGQRKVRIRTLAQTLIPTIGDALGDGVNRTDLAVLERYADPRALLAAGPARLLRLVHAESRGKLGQAKVEALRPPVKRSSFGPTTQRSRCPTSPKKSSRRSGCCG